MQTIPPRHARLMRWRMRTPVLLKISMFASPRTPQRVGYCGERGTDGDKQFGGGPRGAYIASILKSIMRTCFMPFKVGRASDEAMHCRAAVARRRSVGQKAPGPVQPTSRSNVRPVRGPLEDETPTASTSVVARRRQNYGELRKPVDKGPPLWGAGNSSSSPWGPEEEHLPAGPLPIISAPHAIQRIPPTPSADGLWFPRCTSHRPAFAFPLRGAASGAHCREATCCQS
jgi:hypothetical protein